MRSQKPEKARGQKYGTMQNEKQRMAPLFSAAACCGVDPFILGDEKTGGDGKERIKPEGQWCWGCQSGKQKSEQEKTGVGHMPPAFERWQPATSVKDGFIDGHDQALQSGQSKEKDAEKRNHARSRRFIIRVRPGPKASDTMRSPDFTRLSDIIEAQIWGSVLDDMFP